MCLGLLLQLLLQLLQRASHLPVVCEDGHSLECAAVECDRRRQVNVVVTGLVQLMGAALIAQEQRDDSQALKAVALCRPLPLAAWALVLNNSTCKQSDP